MPGKRKTRFGRIVSDKMEKTVVVAVDTPWRHPLYKKTVRRVVKYKAHDENNQCKMGDTVMIEETRPLSKEKRWRIAEILTKGQMAEIQPKDIKVAESQPEDIKVAETQPEDIKVDETQPENIDIT